jgi:hypothetical protein
MKYITKPRYVEAEQFFKEELIAWNMWENNITPIGGENGFFLIENIDLIICDRDFIIIDENGSIAGAYREKDFLNKFELVKK